MKAVRNMNTAESKAVTDKYIQKHHVADKFDLQGLQLCQYKKELMAAAQTENSEKVSQTIADIFYYGFMNGAKQNEKQTADKHNKVFSISSEQYHKSLVELAYYLPCGIGADYFYTFMVLMLNSKSKGIEELLPAKQRKAFKEIVKQHEEHRESEVE